MFHWITATDVGSGGFRTLKITFFATLFIPGTLVRRRLIEHREAVPSVSSVLIGAAAPVFFPHQRARDARARARVFFTVALQICQRRCISVIPRARF